MGKNDFVANHMPEIEAAGHICEGDIENLLNWYGKRLCERNRPMPASIYGATYRGLMELRDALYGDHEGRDDEMEEKLPKINARHLQILSLVSDKATRKFICTTRDETALLKLVYEGALDEWYEITSLGRMLLR